MKRTLLLCLMLAAGCASHFPETTTSTATTQTPTDAPPPPRPRVVPQIIGYSVQNRPIEMYSFGAVEGGRPVLVMGAIHGNETSSADVSGGLLGELMNDARAASDGVGGVPVAISAAVSGSLAAAWPP